MKRVSQLINAKSLNATSKNGSVVTHPIKMVEGVRQPDATTTTNSIPNSEEKINPNSEKSSEKSRKNDNSRQNVNEKGALDNKNGLNSNGESTDVEANTHEESQAANTAEILGSEREVQSEGVSKNKQNGESVLKSMSKDGIINTNESEAKNENGENVHLRNGSKRDGGKNTQRQVSRVEGSTRQTESRGKVARVADSEAARIVNEGREVKVADLGILGGSKEQTVRVVDKANETSSMKEARKRAEARGLKVTFFTGDNLVIEDKSGKWISARAYIKGNHVFARADHSLYTADQLMRHELGHDMIAKGEVDIDAVRERLEETVGKENIDAVAEHYAAAYEGSGMTAEEIWEECICDSLGDMNIFGGKEAIGTFFDRMLPEIKAAASESKSPTQTRGSPEGKASRDLYTLTNEYLREVTPDDRRRFNRSLANLTATLRDGEVRTFYIWATENVYVFRADGYMHGEMIRSYNGNDPQALEDFNNEYDRIDQDTETSAIWAEASENWKDQQRIDSVLYEGRRRPTSNDTLSAGASESDGAGDTEREWKNPRTEKEINEIVNKARAMFGLEPIDSNGKVIREVDSKYKSPEEAKESGKVSDAKFSIEFADDIAEKQRKFAARNGRKENRQHGKASRELDLDGNPIYETERRTTEPTDFKLLQQSRRAADKKYGLSKRQSLSLEA